jgi:pilus assembly protein Flp/PilA
MNRLISWKKLLGDQSGQDLIEYALVAALIALAAVASTHAAAGGISKVFSTISNDLTSAISAHISPN